MRAAASSVPWKIILGAGLQQHTGVTWTVLQAADPRLAEYVAGLGRLVEAFNVAFGMLGCAIAATSFRRGEAWSW